MATLSLTWKDLNIGEDGFNIYRSETPMDVNNMPAPIATVGANVGSYDDTTGVVGTVYYYRVGAIRGTEEKISPEIRRWFANKINVHDVFGDGSVVATYQFNGDATDLGGNYNGAWSGTELYSDGVIGGAVQFNGNSKIDLGAPLLGDSFSISVWVNQTINNSSSRTIVSQNDGTSAGRFFLLLQDTNFRVQYGSSVIITIPDLPIDQWNHFIVSRDVNGNHVVYVDGVAAGSGIYTTKMPLINTQVGSTIHNFGNFDGAIDQVRIFNKPLTQEEVDILYQEGSQYL